MEAAAATLAASVCEESSMLDIEKFEKNTETFYGTLGW